MTSYTTDERNVKDREIHEDETGAEERKSLPVPVDADSAGIFRDCGSYI